MRVWENGHVISGHRGSEVLKGLKGLSDNPAIAGIPVAHGVGPASRTVPAA
jgi:hypothetical protein